MLKVYKCTLSHDLMENYINHVLHRIIMLNIKNSTNKRDFYSSLLSYTQ